MIEAANLSLNHKNINKLKNGNSDAIKTTLFKYTLICLGSSTKEKNVLLVEIIQFPEQFAESVMNFTAHTVALFQFIKINVQSDINFNRLKKLP